MLAILGMGGTVLTLYLISLIMIVLKRLFPVEVPPSPPPDASSPGAS